MSVSWIWLLPTGLACVAAGVAWVSVRALNAEAQRLRDARQALPVLAQQGRTVRSEAARAEAARQATGDALARRAAH